MSIGSLDALGAYGRASGISGGMASPGAAPAKGMGGAAGFDDLVATMVTGTAQQIRAADQAGAAVVAGKGDLIDMVTAISAAENALDTMIAVRDRVVGAYGEIMRMQI